MPTKNFIAPGIIDDQRIRELQADEISTFVGAKKRVNWVLTTLEVWSRLWISVEIGRQPNLL